MQIREAHHRDIPAITAIYNDAVAHTTAIWNDVVVDEDNRIAWLDEREGGGFPVLVAVVVDEAGVEETVGYATYGAYRPHDGYRLTVEHSVYVRGDQRGNGVGSRLMEALIARARTSGKHVMVAGIDAGNAGSIRLHERLGFTHVGTIAQAGMKFGRWLDLTFLQLRLDDAPTPES